MSSTEAREQMTALVVTMQVQTNKQGSHFRAVAALALLFCALPIFGQSDTAALSGFVKDSSGSVIPGATVKVSSEATGVERSTQTNTEGFWTVNALQPGLYAVSAEVQGFRRLEVVHKKLDPGIPTEVDLTLQVGGLSDSVTVTADVAAVQTDSATVGKLVEGKQVSDLQLNGRNPIFLAMLKPGVARNGSLAALSYAVDNGGMSINGSRSNDNLITFDGAVGIRTRVETIRATAWPISIPYRKSRSSRPITRRNMDARMADKSESSPRAELATSTWLHTSTSGIPR